MLAAGSRFYDAPVVPTVPVDLSAMTVMRRRQFPSEGVLGPWLDAANARPEIDRREEAGEITAQEAELCRQWERDGFVILKAFYAPDEIDRAWRAYEDRIADGMVVPPIEPLYDGDVRPGRVLNPHFSVEAMDAMLFDPRIGAIIGLLLGAKAKPFQTIAGHKGSQQSEHSDSIHMTTYPNGFLAATWTAYEHIHADSGPLVYYPGSHKLPYILSEDLGMRAEVGYEDYWALYEPAVQATIRQHDLKAEYFLADKGDMLIWHANLLHGGSKVREPTLDRKAVVCHYFAEGCVCYHDVSGTLSRYYFGPDPYRFDVDRPSYEKQEL